MPTLPRGRCPVCSKEVAVRKGGQLREHSGTADPSKVCDGSAGNIAVNELPPEELLAELARRAGNVLSIGSGELVANLACEHLKHGSTPLDDERRALLSAGTLIVRRLADLGPPFTVALARASEGPGR